MEWLDNPSSLRASVNVAIVATFSAMIIGSDYAMTGLYNVKLLDTLVFVSSYLFGFRVGASVGIISEGAWSFLSPIGSAGAITPFLVAGEFIFALAGWGASRLWGSKFNPASPYPVFMGALLAVCAFLWDLETNAATALLAYWPALSTAQVLYTMFNPFTLAFAVSHEASDFVLGASLAPVFILLIPKALVRRW